MLGYITKNQHLRHLILKEAHESPLTIHPGSTKMYQDLRQRFWWTRMKREIAQYIANCDVCRRVKAEHQRPAGTLQPLAIPEWKWDKIGMDFITGFPRTKIALFPLLVLGKPVMKSIPILSETLRAQAETLG